MAAPPDRSETQRGPAPRPPDAAKAAREARLAKALRDNLRRRKAVGKGGAPKDRSGD